MSNNKKFILNADDFGMSKAFNRAVFEGYDSGILKSASLVANGEGFENAFNKVIPYCQDLGIGIHLNIMEGKSLCSGLDKLTDKNNNFNNSWEQLLIKSLNPKDTVFIEQLEQEFRAQIEKIVKRVQVTHIDSHVHTHAIPGIFELVAKLAKEYGIKQIRTQFEKPYIIPDVYKHINKTYPINLVKVAILNLFTAINQSNVRKYGLNTNDYLIGVSYTSMMTSLTVSCGLQALKNHKNIIAETLIHPCRYDDGIIDNHFEEFRITKNEKLKQKIEKLGFEITNYKYLYEEEN